MEYLTDSIDFAAYLQETDAQTKVKPAGDFVEEAKERLRQNVNKHRIYLPWEKTKDAFEYRYGEVSLYAGQNGHGKTDITTQVALSLVGQGEKVCIASFEMKPVQTVQRMARMFNGTNPMSHEYMSDAGIRLLEDLYDDFKGWTDEKMWLYDQTGTAQPNVVLGMVKYCANELGVRQIFIDSLMKCVKAEDDYNGQKSFVDELCSIAKDCNVHIHLIHHLKKPSKEGDMPDKHDTKGSGSITDQVDNVFMAWRNKPKEDDMKAKGSGSNKATEPDEYLLCRKQRNYEGSADGEPSIALWRHFDAGQFVANQGDQPQMYYQPWPHRSI